MEANEFKRVFLPHHRLLYNIALRISGNGMDAEDMVQETYIRLWKQRDRLDDIANACAYAVTALRHVCFDMLNARPPDGTVTPLSTSMAEPLSDSDPISELERSETGSRINRLIDRLPSPQREVITMRDLEGRDFDNISSELGLSQSNIRVILFRARRYIKEKLNPIYRP